MIGPVNFRNKQGKVLLLEPITIDDRGLKMKSPFGIPFQGCYLGDLLIDPDGTNYKIARMSIQSNVLWLEQY